MDARLVLHAERDALEFRLVMLERTIEVRHELGEASPELAERIAALFTRLREVNELLAEMRGVMPLGRCDLPHF